MDKEWSMEYDEMISEEKEVGQEREEELGMEVGTGKMDKEWSKRTWLKRTRGGRGRSGRGRDGGGDWQDRDRKR